MAKSFEAARPVGFGQGQPNVSLNGNTASSTGKFAQGATIKTAPLSVPSAKFANNQTIQTMGSDSLRGAGQ